MNTNEPTFPFTSAALRMAATGTYSHPITRHDLDALRHRGLIFKDIARTYSFAECVRLSGLSAPWLRKLLDTGRFIAPAFYLTIREARFLKTDIDAWLANRAERQAA